MLSKERIKRLKELLTVDCKSTAYIPEFYLRKEVIPQPTKRVAVFNRGCTSWSNDCGFPDYFDVDEVCLA